MRKLRLQLCRQSTRAKSSQGVQSAWPPAASEKKCSCQLCSQWCEQMCSSERKVHNSENTILVVAFKRSFYTAMNHLPFADLSWKTATLSLADPLQLTYSNFEFIAAQ